MATIKSPETFSAEGSLSQMGARRLRKEFMMVNNEETFNIRAVFGRNERNEEVLDIWDLYMECPSGLYDGYELHARIHFPQNYPFQPPTFFFITPMYHPNIYRDGAVCISILHTDKDDITNSVDDSCTWTPGQNVRSICLSIINLLNYPNIYSPANVDASNELRDHEDRYKEKVLQLLKANARPLPKRQRIEKTEHL